MKIQKKGVSRRKRYPVKTSVNLFYREKPPITIPQLLLAVTVFSVIVVVVAKFAVIDRLNASGRALAEAEALERTVAQLQESNADYQDVLREYQHYYFSAADGDSERARTYVNCLDVMALLEEQLLGQAGVQMVNLNGNMLTVTLTQLNLEQASEIARSLSDHKLVQEVMVSAANKQQDSQKATTVYLNIVLVPKQSGSVLHTNDTEGDA